MLHYFIEALPLTVCLFRVYCFDVVSKTLSESRKGEVGLSWNFADIAGGRKINEITVELKLKNEKEEVNSPGT